jgi:hypothetical protein
MVAGRSCRLVVMIVYPGGIAMARQFSQEHATPALPSAAESAAQIAPSPLPGVWATLVVATGLAIGVGVGLGANLAFAGPLTPPDTPTGLLRAIIGAKGLMLAAGLFSVLWRLRRPVGIGVLVGYAAGLATSAAALVWLWGLSGLLLGSGLFYGGLGLVYFTATKDRLLFTGVEAARSAMR